MKKYRYNGPVSGLTVSGDTGEIVLVDGREYDLPDDDKNVQRLVKLKHLTELPQPASPKNTRAKKDAANAA